MAMRERESIRTGRREKNMLKMIFESMPIICMISIGLAVLVYVLIYIEYRRHGEDEILDIIDIPYPTDGMNPLDLKFNYKAVCGRKDVLSLIPYLGSKGYLRIEYIGGHAKLYKLKEYEGNNPEEKILFDALFANGDEVDEPGIRQAIMRPISKIIRKRNKTKNRLKLQNIQQINSKRLLWLTLILCMYFAIIIPVVRYTGKGDIGFLTPLILTLLCGPTGKRFANRNKTHAEKRSFGIKMFILNLIMFHIISGIQCMYYANIWYSINYIILLLLYPVILMYSHLIRKRTEYGNKMYYKIRGFENYIKNGPVCEFERLIGVNTNYFYENLPFTMVLELNDVLFYKFSEVELGTCQYFTCEGDFTAYEFDKAMERIYFAASPHIGLGGNKK